MEEQVIIVDRENNIIGSKSRSIMRKEGLIHRATFILVFNSEGKVFLQKRTMTKDVYPGYYDICTGGVVSAGEEYDESAERELEEELGIKGVEIKPHFTFFYEDGNNKVWGKLFTCSYDGEVFLQEEEVESGNFYSVDEVLKMSETEKFTPDSLYAFKRYLEGK